MEEKNKLFDKKIKQAEKRVIWMDESDRKSGFSTPLESGITAVISTSIIALESSFHSTDDSSFFEAIVMLNQLLNKLRNDNTKHKTGI